MKVDIINIYFPSNRVKYMLSGYALKGYFDKNSIYADEIEVCVNDYSASDPIEKIVENICQRQADILGFSCYVWNIGVIQGIVKRMKGTSGQFLLFGGPEISISAKEVIYDCFTSGLLLLGEGEETFKSVIEYIYLHKEYPQNLQGIAYYKEGVRCNGERGLTVPMENLPKVYKDGIIPLCKYEGELAFLETQRGCKYRCKYCVYHSNLPKISFYPLEMIKEEIDYLLKEAKVTSIRIIDADFASDIVRAKAIMHHFIDLKEQGYTVKKMMIEFNYYDCDREFLECIAGLKKQRYVNALQELALDSGVAYDSPELLNPYTVISGVGIQSLSNQTLKAVGRKPIDEDEVNHFFQWCKELNIALKLDMILGLPLETKSSYLQGLNIMMGYLKDTDHVLQLALLQMLPGTELEKLTDQYAFVYSESVPRNIKQTSTMSADDLQFCAKLTALTFRIINSPLRPIFFKKADLLLKEIGITAIGFIENIYNDLKHLTELEGCKLFTDHNIDDDYWCSPIFREIPTQLLKDVIDQSD